MSFRNKFYHHGNIDNSWPQTVPGKLLLTCEFCEDAGIYGSFCNRSFCDFCGECEGKMFLFGWNVLCAKCYKLVSRLVERGPYSFEQCTLDQIIPPNSSDIPPQPLDTTQSTTKEELTNNYMGYVYIIKSGGFCKIGRTINPSKRLGEYTKLPNEPNILMCESVCDCVKAENILHTTFKNKHHRGEWYRLTLSDIPKAKKAIYPYCQVEP